MPTWCLFTGQWPLSLPQGVYQHHTVNTHKYFYTCIYCVSLNIYFIHWSIFGFVIYWKNRITWYPFRQNWKFTLHNMRCAKQKRTCDLITSKTVTEDALFYLLLSLQHLKLHILNVRIFAISLSSSWIFFKICVWVDMLWVPSLYEFENEEANGYELPKLYPHNFVLWVASEIFCNSYQIHESFCIKDSREGVKMWPKNDQTLT